MFDSIEEWEKWVRNGMSEGSARVLAGVKGVPYSQLATRRIHQRAPPKKPERVILPDGTDVGEAYDKGSYGTTALHGVVYHDACEKLINKLLDHGADINARDAQGQTPLIVAAASGESVPVRLLLERGADPYLGIWAVDHLGKQQNEGRGRTALAEALRNQMACEEEEWQKVVLALLERGGACMKGGWNGPWEGDEDEDENTEFEDYEEEFDAKFLKRIAQAKAKYDKSSSRASKRRRTVL